jgi:hypothetical protein
MLVMGDCPNTERLTLKGSQINYHLKIANHFTLSVVLCCRTYLILSSVENWGET